MAVFQFACLVDRMVYKTQNPMWSLIFWSYLEILNLVFGMFIKLHFIIVHNYEVSKPPILLKNLNAPSWVRKVLTRLEGDKFELYKIEWFNKPTF